MYFYVICANIHAVSELIKNKIRRILWMRLRHFRYPLYLGDFYIFDTDFIWTIDINREETQVFEINPLTASHAPIIYSLVAFIQL